MKLTYKAIAMMCGFKICEHYRDAAIKYYWYHPGYKATGNYFNNENDAWESCCTDNDLVERD